MTDSIFVPPDLLKRYTHDRNAVCDSGLREVESETARRLYAWAESLAAERALSDALAVALRDAWPTLYDLISLRHGEQGGEGAERLATTASAVLARYDAARKAGA